ncbi:MAG: hypothetical protein R3F37_04870 [Candidatus Competibacteraceae bacterium]
MADKAICCLCSKRSLPNMILLKSFLVRYAGRQCNQPGAADRGLVARLGVFVSAGSADYGESTFLAAELIREQLSFTVFIKKYRTRSL